MLELLRDPIWQFAGAVLALVAIAISVALYFAQRQRKDVTYELLSNTPLLTLREKGLGQLQLTYNGVPVDNPRLAVIRLTNSGNMAIATADYERPISFAFGEGSTVLSSAITATCPDNLTVSVETRDNLVVLQPALLNPRDSLTLKLLVSGEERDLRADGRIHGVHRIHPAVERLWIDWILLTVGLLLLISGAIISPKPEATPVRQENIPALIAVVLGACFFGVAYVRFALRVVKRPNFRRRLMRVLMTGRRDR